MPILLADEANAAALLRTLLDVSLTGVILFRPVYDTAGATIIDLAYEHLNPAAQHMLRLPERPAETFLTLYPSAVGEEGVFAFYCNTYLSGQLGRHQFNYQYDGLDGYFQLVAQRQGPLLVVSFTDTNDQPRTAVEVALRESQARERSARAEAERQRNQWQALVNQAPVGIGYFEGPELRMTATNDMLSAMFGYSQAELLNRPLLEAVPELQNQGFAELMRQVSQTREPYVGTEALARVLRQGQLTDTYYNFVYQPLYDSQGEVLGIIDVAVEVTEQVLARQMVEEKERQTHALNQELQARLATEVVLRQSQEQQELLTRTLGQVPAAVATFTGPEHTHSYFNEQYQTLAVGRAVLGRSVADVYPEVVEQGFIGLLDQVYATGQPFVGRETPVQLLDVATGQLAQRYLDFIYQPLVGEQSQPQGILTFVLDVTEQVLARQQVQALNEELQVANEDLHQTNTRLLRTNADLDNFVYTASHDLKAPISNIEGLLRLLEDMLPAELSTEDGVQPVLARMQEAVERFTRTIAHLTEVSKLQLEFAQATTPTDLLPVLNDVRQDLGPLFAETGGQLEVDVADCPTLLISEKNLRSVLYNLVSNALKYHQPGRPPVVHISCHHEGDRRVLRVQDNGLGLDEGQQRKLFQLFERLHTHVEGTGVGLYMVKKMVENAGGTLTVESRVGDGATFTASFPA